MASSILSSKNHSRIYTRLVFFLAFQNLLAQYDSLKIPHLDRYFYTFKLNNELTVGMIPDNRVPMVSVEWVLMPGTLLQAAENEGMIALLEKFFLRPTQFDLNAIAFQQRIARYNLIYDSYLHPESVHLRINAPKQYLKQALLLLRDCWFYPKTNELEFQREKILIAQRIQQEEHKPTWFLYRQLLLQNLSHKNISRQTIAADYQHIQRITLKEFIHFKNQFFAPQQTILGISGDFKPEEALHWADSLFSFWHNDAYQNPLDTLDFSLPDTASAFLITSEKTNLPTLAVVFPSKDSLSLKRWLAASIIAEIFNQKYSKIGKFLKKYDFLYQLICEYRTGLLFSEFLFSAVIKREKIDYALDFFRHLPVYATHAQWLNSYDIQNAKNKLHLNFLLQNQTPFDCLNQATYFHALFRNYDFLNLIDTLQSITFWDVLDVWEKNINVHNPSIGFLMNSQDVIGSQIEKKLTDFWIQPFGLLYDYIDPSHSLQPISYNTHVSTKKDTVDTNMSLIDTLSTILSPKDSIQQSTLYSPNDSILKTTYDLYFQFNSTQMDKKSQNIIEQFISELTRYPNLRIKLTGHTDSSGPDEYNLKLSLERAYAVKKLLVQKYKVPENQVIAEGMGEKRLKYPENTVQNRAKNRRVEIQFLY